MLTLDMASLGGAVAGGVTPIHGDAATEEAALEPPLPPPGHGALAAVSRSLIHA